MQGEKIVSVCLPVYASPVAWVAMEGLCNQQTDQKWELLVIEDEQYPNGIDFYKKYSERLNKVGCVLVKYKYYEQRISLAEKWIEMFLRTSKNSLGILLQAADNYSEPLRIQNTFHLLDSGYDWSYCPNALFYSFQKRKTILYSLRDSGIGGDMAMSRELAIKIFPEVKHSSIDGWLFDNLKRIKPDLKINQDTTNNWKYGINTDGANRISLNRKKHFSSPQPPFYFTDINIEDYLPEYFYKQLKTYEPI